MIDITNDSHYVHIIPTKWKYVLLNLENVIFGQLAQAILEMFILLGLVIFFMTHLLKQDFPNQIRHWINSLHQ